MEILYEKVLDDLLVKQEKLTKTERVLSKNPMLNKVLQIEIQILPNNSCLLRKQIC